MDDISFLQFSPPSLECHLQNAPLIPDLSATLPPKNLQKFILLPKLKLFLAMHLHSCLKLPEEIAFGYDNSKTMYRHCSSIREYLKIAAFDKQARHLAAKSVYESASVMDNPADLINVAIAELIKHRYELAGFSWCFYSDDAANALLKYLNNARHKSTNALFTAQHPVTLKVSRISYHTLHEYWREVTNNYPELNGVRIHDLRHTFACERVGLVSLEELRALMGHESIQTTLRYQKVTSQKAESAARRAFDVLINTYH